MTEADGKQQAPLLLSTEAMTCDSNFPPWLNLRLAMIYSMEPISGLGYSIHTIAESWARRVATGKINQHWSMD